MLKEEQKPQEGRLPSQRVFLKRQVSQATMTRLRGYAEPTRVSGDVESMDYA